MTLRETSEIAARRYLNAIKLLSGMVTDISIQEFIADASDVGPLESYKFFPPRARDRVRDEAARLGELGARAFLSAALSQSILNLISSGKIDSLPPRLAEQHMAQLRRIVDNLSEHAEWLDIDNDLFQKEFGLSTMRLYAAGAQLVEYRFGIPRSIVTRGGLISAPGKLFAMLNLGGFSPYFEIHTHKFNLGGFNEAGWEECYTCCAELYNLHPAALGMFGGSWFYDPALDLVSPRLSYLRSTPLQGGAHIFFFEEGGGAIDNATSTSPTRRKLYEDGKYVPKSYMLIWGRERQIRWAQQRELVNQAH